MQEMTLGQCNSAFIEIAGGIFHTQLFFHSHMSVGGYASNCNNEWNQVKAFLKGEHNSALSLRSEKVQKKIQMQVRGEKSSMFSTICKILKGKHSPIYGWFVATIFWIDKAKMLSTARISFIYSMCCLWACHGCENYLTALHKGFSLNTYERF